MLKNIGTFLTVAVLLTAAGLMAGPPLGAQTSEVPEPEAVRLVFQGKLEEMGEPAQRAYDFVFRLFTQSDGGLQAGPALSIQDLAVLDGLFAVDLDFGAARLTGSDLWLEVAVRDGELADSFTPLSPRQRLTGTPYAILARGGDWGLIGVAIGGPAASGLGPPAERPAEEDGALAPVVAPASVAAPSVTFSGLDHTITASTVPGQSYSRQIRIGFSDTPAPNPATFSDIRVGVGTLTPQATLHVDQPNVPNGGEAARITFRNLNVQQNATGLRIVESQSKTTRGSHQGLAATTSVAAAGQAGQSSASLAESSGFFAQGTLLGVAGRTTPNELDNIGATNTSLGLGGRFISQPSSPLSLNGTGRYFVGGAYGEVAGQINGNPGGGAVAGIIGIDNSTGSADSWAGYFLGRGHFAGDVGIGTASPTRRLDVAGEARVRVLTPGSTTDDVIVADPSGVLRRAPGNLFADTDWCISSTGGNVYTGLASGPPKCQAGNVGVGTANPAAKLHVSGTTLFSGTAILDGGQMLRGSAAGGARILGDQGNTPARPAIGFFSAVGSPDDGGGGNGIFRPQANTMAFATASQERIRLTSGGSLGLATQTPTALLDVNGTARVRNLTGGPSHALVSAESNGTLHSLPFTGNANDVLHGNGTFSPVSGSDNDWLGAGSGQMYAGFTSDRVAIGTTSSTAKFVVASNLESPAAFVQLSPPANHAFPIGLLVSVSGTATGNGFGAVFQSSASNSSVNNIGLRAQADSPGNINRAMEATASGASFRNTGLEAKVSGNPTFNIGIRTEADGGQQAYGILAVAQNGAFNRAGSFQGDIEVTGTIHNPSDRRLKREIQDLEGALEILSALRPRSFVYRSDENPGLILPEGRHLGLIAQELEGILPELVSESLYPATAGEEDAAAQAYKTVSYLELIPLLVRGLQEQQALLAGQEARIRQLEAEKATTNSKLAALSRRLAALESALKEPASER